MGLSNGTEHSSVIANSEKSLTYMYSEDYSYNREQNSLHLRLQSQEFI